MNDIYLNTIEYRLMEIEQILSLQKEKKSEYQKRMSLILKQVGRKQLQYESLSVSDEEIEAYENFVSNWGNYINQSKKNIVLSNENNNDQAASALIRDLSPVFETSNQTLRELIALNTKNADSWSGFIKGWIKEHEITLIFLSICGMTACLIFIFSCYEESRIYKNLK
ncbi:MAG: MCP four helix bundle domain-containing protein [Proteobacteria bacterium]|nr:MCP four helix bundle domain-containing protein [Pseudomonadota bacterium]